MSAPENLCMLQKFQGSHSEFFIPIGTVSNILNKIGKTKVARIFGWPKSSFTNRFKIVLLPFHVHRIYAIFFKSAEFGSKLDKSSWPKEMLLENEHNN